MDPFLLVVGLLALVLLAMGMTMYRHEQKEHQAVMDHLRKIVERERQR